MPQPIGAIFFYEPRYGFKKGALAPGSVEPPCIIDALAALDSKKPVKNPYENTLLSESVARILTTSPSGHGLPPFGSGLKTLVWGKKDS